MYKFHLFHTPCTAHFFVELIMLELTQEDILGLYEIQFFHEVIASKKSKK